MGSVMQQKRKPWSIHCTTGLNWLADIVYLPLVKNCLADRIECRMKIIRWNLKICRRRPFADTAGCVVMRPMTWAEPAVIIPLHFTSFLSERHAAEMCTNTNQNQNSAFVRACHPVDLKSATSVALALAISSVRCRIKTGLPPFP